MSPPAVDRPGGAGGSGGPGGAARIGDADRVVRARVYRRRRIGFLGAAGVVLAVLIYLPLTLLAPVPGASAVVVKQQATTTAAAAPVFPAYGASAIGELDGQGLLGSAGTAAPQPMASITKIVTALVVLEKHPLSGDESGPTLTLSATDVSYVARYRSQLGKVVPMAVGQKFTEREMLQVALIESANNYATSLAVWAFGSEDAFVAEAQKWVAAHGLTGTTIADTCGMSDRSQATASDLVSLGRLALANPVIAGIVHTKKTQVSNVGDIDNSNKLLGKEGVDGIKTGTLYSYGANLLFSADWRIGGETVTVIGAVLGGHDGKTVFHDVSTLLESTRAGFHTVTLTVRGTRFASWKTPWGQSADAVAGKGASVVVWSAQPVTATVSTEKVGVAAVGARVGTVTYRVGSGTTVSVPLTLSKRLDDPGPWWRLTNPGGLG